MTSMLLRELTQFFQMWASLTWDYIIFTKTVWIPQNKATSSP